MARPYNIRSRFRDSEPTGGERITNGLVAGLDMISQEHEARRAEENDIRARGGVQVGKAPSVGDRVGAVKRGIGRVFGRGGPPSIAVDHTDPQLPPPSMMQARPQASVTFPGPSDGGDRRTMQLPQQVKRSPIGEALSEPDLSYEQTSRSGARYKFDPMRETRAKTAIADRSAQSAHARELEKIRLENQGRERVATIGANQRQETAKYTYSERRVIADRANASKERAAQIIASGRANTAESRQEIQQAILDLREAALAMQQAGLEASGYENAARALEARIPTGTDRIVEEAQPGGKDRVGQTEAEAERLRQEAIRARQRGAGQGGAATKKTPTPAQLERARREPDYRQFLIEKGYKVP